ncbi:unnamed protein product, partial [Candidula unifasciata]
QIFFRRFCMVYDFFLTMGFCFYLTVSNRSHNNTSEPFNKSRVIFYLPRCFRSIENLAKNVSETRERLQIRCNQSQAVVVTDVANKSVGVFSLNWNDNLECLKSFVSTNCYTRKKQVVPNVVHYVSFGRRVFKAESFISVLSAVRFQQPCAILFHGPDPPYGPYWVLLQSLVPNLIHVKMAEPTTIFGKAFGFVQHKSDIVRLEVLNALGGIYLDNDQILVRDVWELQNESFVMSHENRNNLANSMMLARPGAAFIDLWYKQYRYYNPKKWGYHSTVIPWVLARQNTSLIKIVGNRFVNPDLTYILRVFKEHYNISTNYGIHLYTRFYPKIPLNLPDVITWNSTLGEVWRTVLYGKPSMYMCPESPTTVETTSRYDTELYVKRTLENSFVWKAIDVCVP